MIKSVPSAPDPIATALPDYKPPVENSLNQREQQRSSHINCCCFDFFDSRTTDQILQDDGFMVTEQVTLGESPILQGRNDVLTSDLSNDWKLMVFLRNIGEKNYTEMDLAKEITFRTTTFYFVKRNGDIWLRQKNAHQLIKIKLDERIKFYEKHSVIPHCCAFACSFCIIWKFCSIISWHLNGYPCYSNMFCFPCWCGSQMYDWANGQTGTEIRVKVVFVPSI
jgi:hypothetical protein